MLLKGDDTMSAYAQNYVYMVGKEDAKRIAQPTISKERLEEIKKNAEKYLQKQYGKKN